MDGSHGSRDLERDVSGLARRTKRIRKANSAGVACGSALVALLACSLFAGCGSDNRRAVTTAGFEPLTVPRPVVSNERATAAGSDPDSQLRQTPDVQTSLVNTGGTHYVLTVTNTSAIGSVEEFSWVAPEGARVTSIASATGGNCSIVSAASPQGHKVDAIRCAVHLHTPTCTCRGDGGSATIRFEAVLAPALKNRALAGAVEVPGLTPVLRPIPSVLPSDVPCTDTSSC